jgi:2-polyprenyl-3-methyl-5-hydroxy-6-metoxy-1,4-benzoquinol methylase
MGGKKLTDQTWDKRYDQESDVSKEPSLFLKQQVHELPRGMALDLAMGTGRNAIFLAENGYVVDGIDSSEVAIEKVRSFAQRESLPINAKHANLTNYQILENTYDVILNFYFLERSLFPHIMKGLKQGGMLLFETYTIEQPEYGRPHNPAYLLKPNELLQSFMELHIIYYHERIDKQKGGTKAIASLLAQKR